MFIKFTENTANMTHSKCRTVIMQLSQHKNEPIIRHILNRPRLKQWTHTML